MAFTKQTFSGNIGVGSDAPTIYTYRTDDAETLIAATKYFDGAPVEIGDLIQTYSNGTTYIGFYVVDTITPDVTTTLLVGAA